MFKPTNFRLKTTIFWPGVGPANEIAADNILKIVDEGEDYLFVHASGTAVKVPKAQVTAYGVYDADDVPNLPSEGDYKDGNDADSDSDSKDTITRTGGNITPLPTVPLQPEAPTDSESAEPFSDGIDGQSDAQASDDKSADADTSSTLDDAGLSSDATEDATSSDSDDAIASPSGVTDDSGSKGSVVSPIDADTDTPIFTDPDTDGSFNTPSVSNVEDDTSGSGQDNDAVESDDDVSLTPSFTLGKKSKKNKKK